MFRPRKPLFPQPSSTRISPGSIPGVPTRISPGSIPGVPTRISPGSIQGVPTRVPNPGPVRVSPELGGGNYIVAPKNNFRKNLRLFVLLLVGGLAAGLVVGLAVFIYYNFISFNISIIL